MKRLAIITCKKLLDLCADDRPLVPALRARGIEPVILDWRDARAQNLTRSDVDGVLIRSPWDYPAYLSEFRSWLDHLDQAGLEVWNPTRLLRWNFDKSYLREFEAKGIKIPRTVWVREPQDLNEDLKSEIGQLLAKPMLVIKPAISAGARKTYRFEPRAHADPAEKLVALCRLLLKRGTVMIQPFLPEIETTGEYSFLFFNGEFSHALVKKPKRGDFRVQEAFGGEATPLQAKPEWIELARKTLLLAPTPTLYARMDFVPHAGEILLGEVEVFEPSLYFQCAPQGSRQAVDRFADAIVGRFNTSSRSKGSPCS